MNKIIFPFSVNLKLIFDLLLKEGNELRIVGGSVRDFLLNKVISEIDIACKYLPEETISILNKSGIKVLPTGIKHGTVTAFIGDEAFEITSLRIDKVTYGRSADVEFIDDFYLDAKRRDFTINAMSIDYHGNLYDYFGGLQDLNEKKVKFIGDAEERIKEDYLRIMRFFRFSCYYAKEFDQYGLNASIKYKDKIAFLSSDRIRNELIKILTCRNKANLLKTISLLNKSGILASVVSFDNFKEDYFANLLFLEEKSGLEFSFLIKFFALILFDKTKFLNILNRFNFSNRDKKYLLNLGQSDLSFRFEGLDIKKLAKLLLEYDKKFLIDSLVIDFIRKLMTTEDIENFLEIRNFIINTKIPEFPINGVDLLKADVKPKNIGRLLKFAQNHWIEENFNLTKEELMTIINSKNFGD